MFFVRGTTKNRNFVGWSGQGGRVFFFFFLGWIGFSVERIRLWGFWVRGLGLWGWVEGSVGAPNRAASSVAVPSFLLLMLDIPASILHHWQSHFKSVCSYRKQDD